MFSNRREAGRLLGRALAGLKLNNPVVLGVPRGGVEVAFAVAQILQAPLDIIIARKLGAPHQPELAIGAVVDGDHPSAVLNEDIIQGLGITEEYLQRVVNAELSEIARRQHTYRRGRQAVALEGTTAVLVDDGIATGASIRAALRGLRRKHALKIILAVPVAPAKALNNLQEEVDEIVCLETPDPFYAVGAHYQDFSQTTDETVTALLDLSREWLSTSIRTRSKSEGAVAEHS